MNPDGKLSEPSTIDPTANNEDVADDICDQLKYHCQTQSLSFVPKRSKLISIGARNGREKARRVDIAMFEQLEWQRMKEGWFLVLKE